MTLSALATMLGVLAASAAMEPAPADIAALATEVRGATQRATAGEWRARHPSDRIEPFSGAIHRHDTEQWCVRFVRTSKLSDGAEWWRRTAYFFHPPMPAAGELPAGGAEEVTRGCVLGLVWIEAPVDAHAALERATTEVLGAGKAPEPFEFGGFGAASWSNARGWSGPDRMFAVVARDEGLPGGEHGPTLARALLRIGFPSWDQYDLWHDPLSARLPSLSDLVPSLAASVRTIRGVDPGARAQMLALLERYDYAELKPLPTRRAVSSAFRAWLASARQLDPGRRVEALLLADRVMEVVGYHVGPPGGPSDATQTARFAGAEFAWAPLGGAWSYAHSFAREALRTAPPGPHRDRALLRLMELGFDDSGMCDAGDDEWTKVIAEGEPLIARSTDPQVLARAHLMVADAYATVVDLANGAVTEYADPAAYRDREAEAREKALAHYRAAFALDRSSEEARRAWRAASRLLAGSPPGVVRYFCVYD